MSAQVISFDQHHPDYADCDFGGAADEEYSAQIFRGGRFLGTVRSADGAQTWGADWRALGEFPSVDAAAAALIAQATKSF